MNTDRATAGYFVLSWDNPGDHEAVLEESADTEFTSPDRWSLSGVSAFTRTGLENGSYYYRIKGTDGRWSETLEVVVDHHPLPRAFMFFSLGLVLFMVLVVSLYIGHKKTGVQPA